MNVVVYTSFMIQACIIWAELEKQAQSNPKALSVIMWIKLEFLVFAVNLLTVPGMLAILVLLQWTQGGPRFTFQYENRIYDDMLEKRMLYVHLFGGPVINFVMALFLIYNRELLKKAEEGDDRFIQTVGPDIGIYMMLAVSIGQFVGYAFIIFISIFPSWKKDSEVGKIIAQLQREEAEKWQNECKKEEEDKDLKQDWITI